MTPTIPNLAKLRRSPILPLLVLLLTLSSVFIFSNERGHFYRYGTHGRNSGHYMALIANISLENRFLGYYHQRLVSDDGATQYELYNRFPIGGFVLTKLATLPFGGSLSAQLYAAQTAMLLFYAAAALMAYLALSRLTGRPWIALAAVLLAFSSFFLLYYSDMICTETSPSLFGVMLAFHGMVVFAQERRFPQLLLKSCAALLLGWHVFALLLPFIIIGASAELVAALRSPAPAASLAQSLLSRARRSASALFRSQYLLLGVATFAFGATLLSYNFANEYRAFDGRVALTELPSFTSMIRRSTGNLNEAFEADLGAPLSEIWPWGRVIEQQFNRIGVMSAPYALPLPGYAIARAPEFDLHWALAGIAVFAACGIGIEFTRRKILWATLAFYGFFWAVPFRFNIVFHEFEALHYIGMPLTFFAFALLWLRRQSSDRLIMLAAAAAVFVFAFAAYQISQLGYHPDDHARQTRELADFDAIRPITEDKIVYVPPPFKNPKAVGSRYAEDFYLSGSVLIIDGNLREYADYFISNQRLPGTETLTPQNREVFLYRQADFTRWHQNALAGAAGPLIRENFNVYTRENAVLFSKQNCSEQDFESRFILHIFPSDPEDLPAIRRQHSFDGLDFHFDRRGVRLGDECLASIELPPYPIGVIRAGQKSLAGGMLWREDIPLARHRALYRQEDFPRWYDAALADAAGPLARENFDIYTRQNAILFGKQNCTEDDFNARLILHIIPDNLADLPAARQQHGFANLDFQFNRRGIRIDDKCLASIPLPDYPINIIRAGQKDPDGNVLWQTNLPHTLAIGDAKIPLYRQADFARWHETVLANAVGPIARENFDVYLRENAILFGKQNCAEQDIDARLILHIIPSDPADLPAARQQHGFANLDFRFDRNGIRIDAKCLASIPLPDYPIAAIRAGQKTPDGATLWLTELPLAPEIGGERIPFDLPQFLANPGEPAAQSDFTIYLRDNLIIYHKPDCRAEHTEPRFLLHVIPARRATAARAENAFANLDFNFTNNGAWSPRGCTAFAQLPAYPIATIRAGQHAAGKALWRVEFTP